MKGFIVLMIIVGIFAGEVRSQRVGSYPPLLTRESPDDIAMLPNPDTDSESDETVNPPTRDIPQQKFNFPEETQVGHQPEPIAFQPQPQHIPHNIGCTKDHDPLCGSNGKTYNNICEFSQAQRDTTGLTVARRGQC